MKKILIISDYFPPIGSVESLRSAYLGVALQERKWEVYVVCRQIEKNHFIDNSIKDLPPESNIHRIKIVEKHSNSVFNKAINLFQKFLRPGFYREKKQLYKQYFKEASELIEKYKIGYIYSTSGPEVTLLIGYNLKKKFNLNWIADLRDIPEMNKFSKVSDKIYDRALIFLQNKLLKAADAVITVSEPLAKTLEMRIDREVDIVLNGYDSKIHSQIGSISNSEKFSIVYTGQIHETQYQDPRPIFKLLDDLIQSGEIDKNKLSLEFYGTNSELVDQLAKTYLCRDRISVHKQCSLSEAIVYQHGASVLLLLTVKGQKGIYTTKLFDYLAAQRPILAYPNDNDVIFSLISRFNTGICSNNCDDIKDAIKLWYDEWKEGKDLRISHQNNDLFTFSRQYQSHRFVDIIENLN